MRHKQSTNGRQLAKLIEANGLTRVQAAIALGCTERALYAWLSPPSSSTHRNLSTRMLRLAAVVLRGERRTRK